MGSLAAAAASEASRRALPVVGVLGGVGAVDGLSEERVDLLVGRLLEVGGPVDEAHDVGVLAWASSEQLACVVRLAHLPLERGDVGVLGQVLKERRRIDKS